MTIFDRIEEAECRANALREQARHYGNTTVKYVLNGLAAVEDEIAVMLRSKLV